MRHFSLLKLCNLANQVVDMPIKTESIATIKPKPKPKMRKWPSDGSLVNYSDIISPLRNILNQGYKFIRKDQKEFTYEGYNIGKPELRHLPSPQKRFLKESLEYDNKRNKKLLDVVLHILFLLGIEQGRRTNKKESNELERIVKAFDYIREENKNLRLKVDELESELQVRISDPNISNEDLSKKISESIKEKRNLRLQKIKQEFSLDPIKTVFKIKDKEKTKFKKLEKIARNLNSKINSDQWKQILEEHSWTYEEWKSKCEQKKITIDFLTASS